MAMALGEELSPAAWPIGAEDDKELARGEEARAMIESSPKKAQEQNYEQDVVG